MTEHRYNDSTRDFQCFEIFSPFIRRFAAFEDASLADDSVRGTTALDQNYDSTPLKAANCPTKFDALDAPACLTLRPEQKSDSYHQLCESFKGIATRLGYSRCT